MEDDKYKPQDTARRCRYRAACKHVPPDTEGEPAGKVFAVLDCGGGGAASGRRSSRADWKGDAARGF